MKRQLLRFFIFMVLIFVAEFGVAQNKQRTPPVSLVSETDDVIPQQETPKVAGKAIPNAEPQEIAEQAQASKEQVAPAELPPAAPLIKQDRTPPISSKPSARPESKPPFELQEMDEMEELPQEKKDEPAASGSSVPDSVSEQPEEEHIEFQFENTDLKNVIDQISLLFNVSFITDDVINPLGPGGRSVSGSKLSFRTNKPLTPKAAWNLFTSFLDIAGFALVDSGPNMYRVIDANKAATAPLPSYIGVDPSTLEDSDQIIRYVYFIENTNSTTLEAVVKKIMSPTGTLLTLTDLKALLFIDKSYNIKMIMKIVKELDRVNMPQAMAVLKLRRAEATDVESLFKTITAGEEQKTPFYPGPRKPSSALYFPENTRVIAEKRTNSLIILGTPEAIEKIETFVKKNIDKEPERPYSPLFHYDLKYADAKTVADIMTNLMKFGEGGTEAAKLGGIRGGDKFFKPMKFIPDTTTNRIIIRGDYQDYLAFKEIIAQLDKPQPQIAVEILILTVTLNDEHALGTALRKKEPSGWDAAIGTKATFQTSGFAGQGPMLAGAPSTISTPGGLQLLGNLVNLVQGTLFAGNTVLTLGFDPYGVWGIMRALETVSTTHVIANPFLVASNKQKATVEVGEIRRIVAAQVQSAGPQQNSLGDVPATLSVALTPQINSDGKIVLALTVSLEVFAAGATILTAQKNTQMVSTSAILANREVLALGGLIRNSITDNLTKVPILGDVPILGWLFKNRDKVATKQNLLILISAQIIDPEVEDSAKRFSQNRIDDYQGMIQGMQEPTAPRDPIHNWFFRSGEKSVERRVDNFIFKKPAKRKSRGRERERELLANAPSPQTPAPAEPIMGQVAKQSESLASLDMSDIKKQIFEPDPSNQQVAQVEQKHRKKHKHVSLMHAEGNEIEVAA